MDDELSLEEFIRFELADTIDSHVKPLPAPQDVVLYGCGRIGWLVARTMIEKAGGGDVLRLRAVIVRRGQEDDDLTKRAALLRRDSVHGSFKGTIRVLKNSIMFVVNGNPIKFIYANSPSEID